MKGNRMPRPLRLMAVIPTLLLLAACATPPQTGSANPSASASTAPLRHIRLLLGFQPDVQFAPFYLAQQSGLYAEAGL